MPNHLDKTSHLLIDGEFSTGEAKTILMTLIENKIRFHQQENFSKDERYGSFNKNSNRRIDELTQTKAELATLIGDAEVSGERLAINCIIEITRLPQ